MNIYNKLLWAVTCKGCGQESTATRRIVMACLNCGGELDIKPIFPQGTDELEDTE